MMIHLKTLPRLRVLKLFLFITILVVIIHTMISMSKVNISENIIKSDLPVTKSSMKNNSWVVTKFYPADWSLKKVDWHDYKFIEYECKRKGIGEQGKAAYLPRKGYILHANMIHVYELNDAISNEISLSRSLLDTRHLSCKKKLYTELLPSVSIIIPFHNEHPKTLLRTVHSVINRSPVALIKEVIIVDDASTISDLLYIKQNIKNLSPKVKIIRVPKHKGLVKAKLTAATEATADVLVFLESRSEVNVNWLPPLLEPIRVNYRTVVCPVIDIIDNDTFEYRTENECHRGGFNWKLNYQRLPILQKDKRNMPEPYENPVMMGGHFAISRSFFWELGGYDPGLSMCGGEQFELSFKIWECGGRMLTAPCSRVGYINRSPLVIKNIDSMTRNYRRIAEVWMDEFAQYLYKSNSAYLKIDEGDISEQKALRKMLQCKPFRWFISQVASDILYRYPPVEPALIAKGHIQTSELNSDLIYCIQAISEGQFIYLDYCYATKILEQEFYLTWYKEIRTKDNKLCWDLPDTRPMSRVVLNKCHGSGGNQKWWYHEVKKQIVQGINNCLDWDIISRTVYIKPCNTSSLSQQWDIEIVHTNLSKLWHVKPNELFELWNSSIHYEY